ncbi:hypothetical protein OC845_005551 [Tilletia horrida]|nr:hypothetical protein OC845_005551 [Tilletia horrida]
MSDSQQKKAYHTQCTGQAMITVQTVKTANEEEAKQKLTLFGACFCPFVQRAWATLCLVSPPSKSSPWTYREVDPYMKPADLLELSPKGLVPALKLEEDTANYGSGVRGICESTVIMEYIIERFAPEGSNVPSLLPPLSKPYERALHRVAADRVNRTLIPSFYRYLQAQEADKQVEYGKEFVKEVEGFIRGMEAVPSATAGESASGGCWDGSDSPGFVDFMAAPWLFRATNVLKHYRGLELESALDPELKDRYVRWQKAVLEHPAWTATVSTEQTYLESYTRCAS